jgi:hypothetical protein
VSTLAGLANATGSNDGTGNAARFTYPHGVGLDSLGNVYVADSNNYTIRKVTPAGVVTTLAGLAGSSGSTDGTGNAARFNYPCGVAVDSVGNVYVTELSNNTIRKVTPAGVVTTLAGLAGSSGSADGTGNAARFKRPLGVAVDSAGNIYVADGDNNTIRKVTPEGVVTTLAGLAGYSYTGSTDGTGSAARFNFPCGIAVDSTGNIYVADTRDFTIRKVTPVGVVTTIAGQAGGTGSVDGVGSSARFYDPSDVAVDNAGNVYVADANNYTIRKVTPAGVVTTIAGTAASYGSANGTGSTARFNEPYGVAVDGAGNVYVADLYNNTIRKVTSAGVVTTMAGLAGVSGTNDGTGSTARFNYPSGVALDSAGNIYVADAQNNTIRKVTPARVVTTLAGLVGSHGNVDGVGNAAQFQNPMGVTVDSAGNVYVGGGAGGTIRKVTSVGVVTTLAGGYPGNSDGTGSNALFFFPYGVAVDSAGNVYVADSQNHTIRKGWPASGGFGAIIITQPLSKTVQSGSNVSFTVNANGYPLPNYQWQFDGQNIFNATNATLTLNAVAAANSGGYSVVVSNPYGSVTSATASLAVLTDGSNGNTPVPITATPGWSKPSTAKNLVFITHGWQSVFGNPTGPPAQPWMAAMTNAIAQQLGGNSTWQFETYDWTWASWTLEPQQALSQAEYIGTLLGKAIAGMGYQQVHLIAHSAGSGMIQAIADQLQAAPNPPLIQLTFLDPYIGIFHQEQNNYGKNADWSDCYFVEDGTRGFTGSYLNHAFNVDVSWVDPAHTTAPYFGFGGGEVALSSHGYPIDFYLGSITGGNFSCSSAYGFALSQEMEGVFWFNNQANYPVGSGPFLPCSPPDAVKNPIPGIVGLEAGAAGAWAVITAIPHALSQTGATLIGNAGAALQSIWSQLSLVQSGGVRPLGGTSTNIPAWLAVGLTVTNAINFVQFDAGFTDTNAAQGLLTVYWNTNQVGIMVDERVAPTNLQTYRFTLPGTVTNGIYTLSFRLDSFNNSSSIAVTNVATGFVGMTQPITLNISLTNGAPLLQLTAATNFTYLIQSSTNLVAWTPAAMILNTNGTAQFMDFAVTNSKARFYRAVMQ